MKKFLTTIAVMVMMVSGNAFATGSGHGGKCNGIGNCNQNKEHHNNYGDTTTYNGRVGDTNVRNVDRSVTNIDKSHDNYARGGRGGRGGDGGDGGDARQGQAQGQIGINRSRNTVNGGDQRTRVSNGSESRSDVRNSGNSSNRNANVGIQGQVGIVKGGNTDVRTGDVDASSRNKLSNDSTSNANVYIGGGRGEGQGGGRTLSPDSKSKSSSRQQQSLDGNNSSATNDGNNTTVDASDNSVYEAQKRNPVASAWSAPLVTSNDTCMGSTSAGGQGITLGLSFATTWRDKDCVIRKDARFLHNAQRSDIALSLMCEKDTVRRAVERAGTPAERKACGLDTETVAPVPVSTLTDDEGQPVTFGK